MTVKQLTQEELKSLAIAIYDEAYEQGYICGCKDKNSQHNHAIDLLTEWLMRGVIGENSNSTK